MTEPRYRTEAELCAVFIDWVKRQEGWTAYPETEAWDILLAHVDGTQIGVQAKLRFNMKVLQQAVGTWYAWDRVGPDFRAILVPDYAAGESQSICRPLGLMVFRERYHGEWRGQKSIDFEPRISGPHAYQTWHYWNPAERLKLPAYVPDVIAGAPAPSQLTEWKIKALRICAVLELRGYVTRADFSHYNIDHRRWTAPDGWLVANGTAGQWKWRDGEQGFAVKHPTIYAQIRAEVAAALEMHNGELRPQGALL